MIPIVIPLLLPYSCLPARLLSNIWCVRRSRSQAIRSVIAEEWWMTARLMTRLATSSLPRSFLFQYFLLYFWNYWCYSQLYWSIYMLQATFLQFRRENPYFCVFGAHHSCPASIKLHYALKALCKYTPWDDLYIQLSVIMHTTGAMAYFFAPAISRKEFFHLLENHINGDSRELLRSLRFVPLEICSNYTFQIGHPNALSKESSTFLRPRRDICKCLLGPQCS